MKNGGNYLIYLQFDISHIESILDLVLKYLKLLDSNDTF